MAPRTRKAWVRTSLRILLVAIGVVVVWFAGNRLLCSRWSVETLTLDTNRPTPKFHGRLTIATYNIARGGGAGGVAWQHDREAHWWCLRAIGKMLEDHRADLVVLNEIDFDTVSSGYVDQACTIARAGGFPWCVEQCNYDLAVPLVRIRIGNAILSRYPVRAARLLALPGYRAWETALAGRKNALVAEIELAGVRFNLLATHLEHRSEAARVAEARQIEAFRLESSLPLVVAGDLNSTPPGFPTAVLSPDGENAMSILLESGGYRASPTTGPAPSDLTFRAGRPMKVIDWILVPPTWRISSKEVVASDLSDHLPVVLEVEISNASVEDPR